MNINLGQDIKSLSKEEDTKNSQAFDCKVIINNSQSLCPRVSSPEFNDDLANEKKILNESSLKPESYRLNFFDIIQNNLFSSKKLLSVIMLNTFRRSDCCERR